MKNPNAEYALPVPPEEYLRHEFREVTASERKMDETQRETDPSVVASVKAFLTETASVYTPGDSPQYGDALYGAMNSAGAQMAGLGPADDYPFPLLASVTNAGRFYRSNVTQAWKQLEGDKLGVAWDDPLVFASWKNIVTTGEDIDPDMLEPTSIALKPTSWLSPDDRMLIPPPPTRAEANTDFFEFCHIVSLAPEWYVDGLVRLNPPPVGGFIRPVSFDGMTSPLWVQRPPDQHAATGGGALETLNATTIELGSCLPVQPYILTDAMTAALIKSPSVNLYSVNLALVPSGGTPEDQLLGTQEVSIVQQVREARTEADRAFQNQPTADALASSISLGGDATVIPQNAVPRKRTYASIAELKEQMRAWAKADLVEHRGQSFPSERFLEEAQQSPEKAAQIAEAAAELLAESDDPRVLLMVAQLGDNTPNRAFYLAVLRRLETALPEVHGIRFRTLRGDLLQRLADRVPATDPDLSPRAHALLQREDRPDIRLEMLNQFDPNGESTDVLDQVCATPANPSLVANAIAHIAARHPERLLEAANSVARQKDKTRAMAYTEIQRAAPIVIERLKDTLTKALGLN